MHQLNLVVFSVQEIVFGVYAGHVEELLKYSPEKLPEEGKDEYYIPYKGQPLRVINFSKRLHLDQKGRAAIFLKASSFVNTDEVTPAEQMPLTASSFSSILIIKHHSEGYLGVCIDTLKKLATISIDHIHSLPLIMEKKKQISGIWGVTVIENSPVILIDLAYV